MDWPRRYFPGVTDIETQIVIDGVTFRGRGVDANPDLALEKSAAEAVEHFLQKRVSIRGLGFAVSGEMGARAHAEAEALERFYLMKHLEEGIAFTPEANLESGPNFLFTQVRDSMSGVKLEFFRMRAGGPLNGLVARLKDETDTTFGFALGNRIDQAAMRCFFEAMMNHAWKKDRPDWRRGPFAAHLDPVVEARLDLLCRDEGGGAQIAEPQLAVDEVDFHQVEELADCPMKPVVCRPDGQEVMRWR